MNNASFNVSGVTNANMKTSLKNALEKIEGVRSVDIDKTLGTVEIEYNPPASPARIENCIRDAGFPAQFTE